MFRLRFAVGTRSSGSRRTRHALFDLATAATFIYAEFLMGLQTDVVM